MSVSRKFPERINWDEVEMLSFDGGTVTVLLGARERKLRFETADELDVALQRWYRRISDQREESERIAAR